MSAAEFGVSIAAGFIAGVLATLAWALGQWSRRQRRSKKNFGNLAGDYEVTRKHEPDVCEPGVYNVAVEGNVLKVEVRSLGEGESITAEIVMNDQVPRSGRGHYHHVKPGEQMWGFWDVQVVPPDKLLVHVIFSDTCDREALQGRVWKRAVAAGEDGPVVSRPVSC